MQTTPSSPSFPLVDSRAPRTNQAIVALFVIAAWLADQPWVLGAISLLLVAGVSGGHRWIPAYHLYFGVIRPRFGEGLLEDERAPSFAQAMGSAGIFVAFVCIQAGAVAVGWFLAVSLAVAGAFAAVTGICLGCRTYRLMAMLRRIRPLRVERIDPADVELDEVVAEGRRLVGFSHPLCHDCQVWTDRLQRGPTPFVTVDVRERPELARRYGIALLPTVFEIEPDGTVVRQLAP